MSGFPDSYSPTSPSTPVAEEADVLVPAVLFPSILPAPLPPALEAALEAEEAAMQAAAAAPSSGGAHCTPIPVRAVPSKRPLADEDAASNPAAQKRARPSAAAAAEVQPLDAEEEKEIVEGMATDDEAWVDHRFYPEDKTDFTFVVPELKYRVHVHQVVLLRFFQRPERANQATPDPEDSVIERVIARGESTLELPAELFHYDPTFTLECTRYSVLQLCNEFYTDTDLRPGRISCYELVHIADFLGASKLTERCKRRFALYSDSIPTTEDYHDRQTVDWYLVERCMQRVEWMEAGLVRAIADLLKGTRTNTSITRPTAVQRRVILQRHPGIAWRVAEYHSRD